MKLLYLTEDYFASKVHNNLLVRELVKNPELEVYVFSPLRDSERKSLSSSFINHDRLHVIAPLIDIGKTRYKLDFWAKLRCKVRLIEQHVPISQIHVVHAATLYSEGGVAMKLKAKYGIPYFISMRGCDAVTYTNKMFHLWLLGNRVLNNASAIAAVTPIIKHTMLNSWKYRLSRKSLSRCQVLNNGIDSIWLENIRNTPRKLNREVNVICIGRFDYNKNVVGLIKAIDKIQAYQSIKLTLIGGKGELHDEITDLVRKNSKCMSYLGEIYDKEKLIEIIRGCDIYAMASHSETFGLVYAECLTQGLPLVYSLNTGFDQMYPQGYVGYGVDSHSVDSIGSGIRNVIDNYDRIKGNISKLDYSIYNWDYIVDKYLAIYSNMLKK